MLGCKRDDMLAPIEEERIWIDAQSSYSFLTQRGESCFEVASSAGPHHDQFLSECLYGSLGIFDVELRIDVCWVHQQSHHSSLGYGFAQHLKALGPQHSHSQSYAGNVGAGMLETCYETVPEWFRAPVMKTMGISVVADFVRPCLIVAPANRRPSRPSVSGQRTHPRADRHPPRCSSSTSKPRVARHHHPAHSPRPRRRGDRVDHTLFTQLTVRL